MIWNWYFGSTPLEELTQHMGEIKALLDNLNAREDFLMSILTDLEAKVAHQSTVVNSVLELVKGLSDKIKDAGLDEAKLAEIAAELDANSDKLAAAVAANTVGEVEGPAPYEPAPEPVLEPAPELPAESLAVEPAPEAPAEAPAEEPKYE
jgi:uncharacterized protein YoxC